MRDDLCGGGVDEIAGEEDEARAIELPEVELASAVDEELDLAIVVATNIGGPPAHDGVKKAVAALYERFR